MFTSTGPRNVDIDRLVSSCISDFPIRAALNHHQLLEIAEGAAYLHSEGIVHGDLRGSNILIDSGHHPRLADFGLGSFSDSTVGSQTSKGGGSVR
jgi:serine/threonine protein kinase